MSRTRTEEITDNPWRAVAFLALCLIVIAITGCATTGPATPETVDAQAYKAGRIAAHGYLAVGRDQLDVPQREAVRQVYNAIGIALRAAHASGLESVQLDAMLAQAITDHISDPDLRPLATELVAEIVAQVRERIPADVTGLDSWRVALAVHRGIADVLPLYGIDPEVEVTP